jgi:hypothetical protein
MGACDLVSPVFPLYLMPIPAFDVRASTRLQSLSQDRSTFNRKIVLSGRMTPFCIVVVLVQPADSYGIQLQLDHL